MKISNVLIGILYTCFGIYLWTHPVATLASWTLFLGILHIAIAAVALFYSWAKKLHPIPYANILVSFLIGAGILALPLFSAMVLLWIFVIAFLAFAIWHLRIALASKDRLRFFQIALAVLAIIYAISMILNPAAGLATLAKVIAFGVIVNGVSYFFTR